MSRIGKKAILLPDGVSVTVNKNNAVVQGPKGKVNVIIPPTITVELDEANKLLKVHRPDDEKQSKAYHGLGRSLLNNAVTGVSVGFQRVLEIVGTGYNAKLKGRNVELQIGYCLPQIVVLPEGITAELPTPTKMIFRGCDRQQLGQFVANVRSIRKPDAYKGKGIRYEGEVIKLKAGKSFGTA